jgi:hypothetical protein
MPIMRNPFNRRPGATPVIVTDENQNPNIAPGFERVDTMGSKGSSVLSIRSAKSHDNNEYKMSGTSFNLQHPVANRPLSFGTSASQNINGLTRSVAKQLSMIVVSIFRYDTSDISLLALAKSDYANSLRQPRKRASGRGSTCPRGPRPIPASATLNLSQFHANHSIRTGDHSYDSPRTPFIFNSLTHSSGYLGSISHSQPRHPPASKSRLRTISSALENRPKF